MMGSDRERGHRRIAVILMVVLLAGAGLLLLLYPHQMEVSSEGEGAVSPVSGEGSVLDPFEFTAVPTTGWSLGEVEVDGGSTDVDGTTVTVTPDILFFGTVRIHVTFTEDTATHTLTVTSEGEGAVTPSGTSSHADGSAVSVTASPADGMVVGDVLVDGSSVGPVNVLGLTMDSDRTVHVVFRPVSDGDVPVTVSVDVDVEIVTATLGSLYDWGDVEPHGTVHVAPGASLRVTVTVNPGFVVDDFVIDGVSDGSKLEHLLKDIREPVDIEIMVHGVVDGYTVTATAGDGGSVSPSGETVVAAGHDLSFTLTPRSGYSVSHVLVDGVRHDVAGRTFTLEDVRADHTVQAVFSYTGGGGGGGQPSPPTPPAEPVLQRITVSGDFDRDYVVGQVFDTAGMTVTAGYSDGSSRTVSGYTVSPAVMAAGTTEVTVSYAEDGVTRTATVTVTVSPRAIASIDVTSPPTRTVYNVGDTLETAGMVVTATWNDGSTSVETGYTVSPTSFDAPGQVIVTVTLGGFSDTFTVTVAEVPVEPVFDVFVTRHDTVTYPSKTVHLTGHTVGSRIVQPGDSETLVLDVDDTHPGHTVGIMVSGLTGDTDLADHLVLEVSGGGTVHTGRVSDIAEDDIPLTLGPSGSVDTVTVTVSFPHGPDNNAAVGMTMGFTLSVVTYQGVPP